MGAPLSRAEFRSKLLESRQERPAVRQPRPQEQRSPANASNVATIANPPNTTSKVSRAVQFFREKLADGPRLSCEIAADLAKMGIDQRVANRARQRIGVQAYQRNGHWWLEKRQ